MQTKEEPRDVVQTKRNRTNYLEESDTSSIHDSDLELKWCNWPTKKKHHKKHRRGKLQSTSNAKSNTSRDDRMFSESGDPVSEVVLKKMKLSDENDIKRRKLQEENKAHALKSDTDTAQKSRELQKLESKEKRKKIEKKLKRSLFPCFGESTDSSEDEHAGKKPKDKKPTTATQESGTKRKSKDLISSIFPIRHSRSEADKHKEGLEKNQNLQDVKTGEPPIQKPVAVMPEPILSEKADLGKNMKQESAAAVAPELIPEEPIQTNTPTDEAVKALSEQISKEPQDPQGDIKKEKLPVTSLEKGVSELSTDHIKNEQPDKAEVESSRRPSEQHDVETEPSPIPEELPKAEDNTDKKMEQPTKQEDVSSKRPSETDKIVETLEPIRTELTVDENVQTEVPLSDIKKERLSELSVKEDNMGKPDQEEHIELNQLATKPEELKSEQMPSKEGPISAAEQLVPLVEQKIEEKREPVEERTASYNQENMQTDLTVDDIKKAKLYKQLEEEAMKLVADLTECKKELDNIKKESEAKPLSYGHAKEIQTEPLAELEKPAPKTEPEIIEPIKEPEPEPEPEPVPERKPFGLIDPPEEQEAPISDKLKKGTKVRKPKPEQKHEETQTEPNEKHAVVKEEPEVLSCSRSIALQTSPHSFDYYGEFLDKTLTPTGVTDDNKCNDGENEIFSKCVQTDCVCNSDDSIERMNRMEALRAARTGSNHQNKASQTDTCMCNYVTSSSEEDEPLW